VIPASPDCLLVPSGPYGFMDLTPTTKAKREYLCKIHDTVKNWQRVAEEIGVDVEVPNSRARVREYAAGLLKGGANHFRIDVALCQRLGVPLPLPPTPPPSAFLLNGSRSKKKPQTRQRTKVQHTETMKRPPTTRQNTKRQQTTKKHKVRPPVPTSAAITIDMVAEGPPTTRQSTKRQQTRKKHKVRPPVPTSPAITIDMVAEGWTLRGLNMYPVGRQPTSLQPLTTASGQLQFRKLARRYIVYHVVSSLL
jgi:hypothetical protein